MKLWFLILFTVILLPVMAQDEPTTPPPTLDSAFSTPTGMTDQQAREAQTFIHAGQRAAIREAGCRDNQSACNANDPGAAGQVLFNHSIEDQLGKLYGGLFGTAEKLSGGNSITLRATETNSDGKVSNKKSTDYCLYLALGYEAISTMVQTASQQSAAQVTQHMDPQLGSLLNLQDMHRARKRTAGYQGWAYGGVASCYVLQAVALKASPSPQKNWQMYARAATAAGISSLYFLKSKKHKNAVEALQTVIDSLENAERCDPWTGTSCFCKQASSRQLYPAQFQDVCVLNAGNPEGPRATFGCGVMVNGQMSIDRDCKCRQNNTCFQGRIASFTPRINLGRNFLDLTNKTFEELATGQFDQGRLEDYQVHNAVNLSQAIAKLRPKQTPKVSLSDEQQSLANELAKVVPPEVAALAASGPSGAPPLGGVQSSNESAALAKVPKNLQDKVNEISAKYKNGSGGSQASVDDGPGFTLPAFPGAEAAAPPSTEVVSFAEKAFSNADVSNAPQTPIFDIISNRYRRSAWNRFIVED